MNDGKPDVTVKLTNQKVQCTVVSSSHPDRPIITDVKPPIGDGQGFGGLELMLMSFAVCSATTVVYLLRMRGKTISGFSANATGVMRDQPPMTFQKIFLEFILNSLDTKDEDLQKAIQLAEKSVCPVWQLLKNNVEVITEYKII